MSHYGQLCVTEIKAEVIVLIIFQASKVNISHFQFERVYFGPVSTCMHFFSFNYFGSIFDYFCPVILMLKFHPDFTEFSTFLFGTRSYF